MLTWLGLGVGSGSGLGSGLGLRVGEGLGVGLGEGAGAGLCYGYGYRPLVLTFLPEGRADSVRWLSTKVLPLSNSPSTATTAPDQPWSFMSPLLESASEPGWG